jgi:tetratricopeptide (TPR) repeat protein/tRNA A-37 threonylcarbamoyl transferase component Bud32
MTASDPPPSASSLRDWFDRAMEQPALVRRAWLDAHVADPDLRRSVSRLVAAADSGGVLDASAASRIEGMARGVERPADELLGQRFAGFRLVRVIGRGGMATVFLGERDGADFEQRAAIKLLRRGLYSELEQRLFQRERRVLAQLSHPNIARLIDGGVTATSIPFLVLEYVDGQPITLYADSRALPLVDRLRLVVEVCRAVAAAHRALIVHRDLKPANILVDAEGRVKLLDFGIAKLLSDAEPTAEARPTAGAMLTPEYAAPEQFDGRAVTMATDVHALGVILHELVHGSLPGLDPSSRRSDSGASRTGREPRLRLARTGPRARGDLDKVLRKALAPDPGQRYPDAAALADDIENFLASRPVLAHPASNWYRARRFVSRHRGGVLLTLLLLGGMIGSLAFALWQTGLAREQARVAQVQAARAEEVQGFIESLFSSITEGRAPASEVSVLELVERATARIEQAYPENPDVEASLLALFARIQLALGNFERNRDLAADAMRANVAAYGELDPRSLDAAFVHGQVLRRLGEYDAALAEFTRWRDRLRAAGVRGFELARMLDAISMIRMEQGMPGEEAIALKREVLEERERDPDLTPEERATGYNNLGAAYQYAGDLAGSLEWYDKARELNRQIRPDSRQHAVSLLNVGMVLGYAGRWREAREYLSQGAAVMERIELAGHPTYASFFSQLCVIEAELDAFGPSRAACDRAVELTRAALGESHLSTVFALSRRALAAYIEGRFDDGDADLDAASRANDTSTGDRNYNEQVILSARTRGLRLRGRAAELVDVSLRLLDVAARSSRRSPSPAELIIEANLVWACAQARVAACDGHDAERVRRLLEDPRFARSAQRLAARVALAEAASSEARASEAMAWLEGFETQFDDALGADHSQFGWAHLARARAFDAIGSPEAAQAQRDRARAIALRLPPMHPLRAAAETGPD